MYMHAYMHTVFIHGCIFITDAMSVVTETESFNTVDQLDNGSFEVATINCVINDTASNDKAERPSIGDYCLHNGRRPFLVSQTSKTNKSCKYILFIPIHTVCKYTYNNGEFKASYIILSS